jgi:quinol-cytochrome oxidoreductase complex cytochrome b subunit
MLVIPGGLFALIGLHLYLVDRLGVSLAAVVGRRPQAVTGPTKLAGNGRAGLVRPGGRGGSRMASRRIEERRAQHKRYKEDVERTGKPFFPYAMFHDTVMSLIVVCVIVGLACVWYFTADGSTDPGWLGPYYTEEADPGTTNFVPRPDWYFYFLFYLLRIFKWPDTVVLGTVGIPNILLAILIAAAVHRSAPRAPALPASGRDRGGDRGRPGDGDADVQGRHGEGVPGLRDARGSAEMG